MIGGITLFNCFIRSVLTYFLLLAIIRLLGKRQLGEMEPSEFVVSLLVADLAASIMQDTDIPLLQSAIPICVVFLLELLLSSLSYHSILVRRIFCGKPTILMEDGKIIPKNLKKTRVTPDELTEHLRESGIVELNTVKYAILETNGQISTLIDPQYQPATAKAANINTTPLTLPITIICNGKLMAQNMKLSGKSEKWLQKTLEKHKCCISQVLLLTVDSMDNVYISLDE